MKVSSSFILTDDISNHLPIFISLDTKRKLLNKDCINKMRRLKHYNENSIMRFCNILNKTELHEIIEKNNIHNSNKNNMNLLINNFITH